MALNRHLSYQITVVCHTYTIHQSCWNEHRASSKMFACSLLLLIFVSFSSTATVTWSPNKSFNLASNFKDGVAPCSKRTVVFPASVQESIMIESTIAASELILPLDGVLTIAEGGTLFLGADSKEENCTSDTAFYENDSSSSWNNPAVWNSSRYNKATPDAERVPCYDDSVIFPSSAQFTVLLPDFTQYIYSLTISGRNLTTVSFLERINSPEANDVQQFVLGLHWNSYPVVVRPEPCKSAAGCPCQNGGLVINCKLKFCPKPKCYNPIKPIGHCCHICGGSLLFEIGNFDMRAFKKLVKSIVNDYGADDFVYHIGMLPLVDLDTNNMLPKRVQVIVMDKGDYTGASSEVINEIGYQMANEWIKHEKLLQLSGSPDSETGLGGKIAVSMFFAVVIAMGVLFAFYYRKSQFKLPEFRGGFVGAGALSRFQKRSDSVVTLTRRDSAMSSAGGTAFRNPLYDSKRGRVVVTESTLEG
jgi:protein amnionless